VAAGLLEIQMVHRGTSAHCGPQIIPEEARPRARAALAGNTAESMIC
jgi:hypothetical protein